MIGSFNNIEFYLWPFLAALLVVLTVLVIPLGAILYWAWKRKHRGRVRPRNLMLWSLVRLYLIVAGALSAGIVFTWWNKITT